MINPSVEVATLGGGCFWCLEAVYDQLKGVADVVSGYAGGHVARPSYEQVCGGRTGHAEVVQVTFDPAVITFRQVLEVFFAIHDPTTLNRQGGDIGPQYRSAIFYHSPEQKATAEQVIADLSAQKLWEKRIVTEIAPLDAFYPAEAYHQEYFAAQSGAGLLPGHNRAQGRQVPQGAPGQSQTLNRGAASDRHAKVWGGTDMKVLVTGGAGYIGSVTAAALLEAGHSVTVFDNLVTGHRSAVPSGAAFCQGDIRSKEDIGACLAGGFDAIIHFAAFIEAGESMVDPGKFFENNTCGALEPDRERSPARRYPFCLLFDRCGVRRAGHAYPGDGPDRAGQRIRRDQADGRADAGLVPADQWAAIRGAALFQCVRRDGALR